MNRKVHIIVALVFCAVAGFFSCSPKVVYKTETKIEYRDRVVHDTAVFNVPVEIEKVVTKDTVSVLENSFARSVAEVSEGFLSHSLESKPQVIKVPVEVHVTDTLYKEASIIEKEVEKSLSKWQQFQINAFWWFVGALLALIGTFILIKKFKK